MDDMSGSGSSTPSGEPRHSTRRIRWVVGTVIVLAWMAWAFFVDDRLSVMEQDPLTEEHGLRRRTFGMYAAWLLYFPPVAGLWLIVFPGDRERLPWPLHQAKAEQPEPVPSTEELAGSLRALTESTRDRTSEKERIAVLALVDEPNLAGALEQLARSLVEADQPVSELEGQVMENLARVLPLSRRAHRDVIFAARGLSGPR